MGTKFQGEYNKLNSAQKEAVDNLSGPIMVVAGPGTGKTQVLAMRIANILNKTDIKADGVLCLTFTNSAVAAMKTRLKDYLGEAGEQVNVSTFHSFGMKIIESYFHVLGLESVPKLLDDADTVVLFDEVLSQNEWEYLRPRADHSRYFSDLRSLASLFKRERITSKLFLKEIEKDIKMLENDPDNISSRGESKGQLKKEVQSKMEGLKRSREVAKFFDLYEEAKKAKNVLDYDDVLEDLVKIVEKSKDAVADIREKYLYVLVDEHQDSSRVQNEFLKAVWADVESPEIFVVGDDRQLIYGFSGASIDHFQGFKKTFKGAKLITLVDNYRSTQVILDASHALLQSVMTDKKLVSQSKESQPIRLFEAQSPQEEIIAVAQDIKEKKIKPSECAILVPKNVQVREAMKILHEHGLPVSAGESLNLFDQADAQAFIRVLKIISDPTDMVSLAASFFDKLSGIAPLEAHKYLAAQNMRNFSFPVPGLFNEDSVSIWLAAISRWRKVAEGKDLLQIIELVGEEVLPENGASLVTSKEILETILALAAKEIEKNKNISLKEFISLIERLESYNQEIPLITQGKDGVNVMTLHSSKGLEFDYVWIAHMDEGGLNGGKKAGFVLPEAIADKVLERDVDRVKRKLYVAITRAKRFCTLSYSIYSKKESELEVARVIADLPEEVFTREEVTVRTGKREKEKKDDIKELTKLVAEKYKSRNVSVSLLNNFFECPWKWYFRNLLQLPEEKSESLEFGSAVHEAIDQILKSGKITLPEDEEVARIVSRWAQSRLKEIEKRRDTEKSISMKDSKFPGLNIYGKIDLVEYLPGGDLRVTDFKTGSVRKKSDIEKLDDEGRMSGNLRQLAMYSYLLENSIKAKVQESRLEFLEARNSKESIYDRVITKDEIELLVKDIKDYDSLVKTGQWGERPCNYNSYGKNTECEYCALAEVFK
ncbi:MAG: ATP-dependent DNA helicase [Patescibacteria group bacterium]